MQKIRRETKTLMNIIFSTDQNEEEKEKSMVRRDDNPTKYKT